MARTASLSALALLGWGLFIWALRRPIPPPTERIVTQVQYVDRVVDRVVEKKTTKPNGEVVETRSVTRRLTQESSEKKLSSAPIIPPKPPLPQYSLGLAYTLFPAKAYTVEAGYRLGETPLWLTLQLSTKLDVAAGIRIEF